MTLDDLKTISLNFTLGFGQGRYQVCVDIDNIPVWHSGDTPHEAFANALASVMPECAKPYALVGSHDDDDEFPAPMLREDVP